MRASVRTLILMTALLSSCSVKEERADCPCRLEVDFSAFAPPVGDEDDLIWTDRIPLVIGSRIGSRWHSDVRKGIYTVSAVRAGAGAQVGARQVTYPDGSEPDSLYAYAETVSCFAERVSVECRAWKQFCSVTLREKEPTAFRYGVRSRTGAFSRGNLMPLEAPLSYPVQRRESGLLRFRLPRQGKDSGLVLSVREASGTPWELPLGEWLEKAGYDWSQPSLEDISLEIDYSASEVRIDVLDWESGASLTLKI